MRRARFMGAPLTLLAGAGLLAAAATPACKGTKAPTQVILEIDSDIPVPDEMNQLGVRVFVGLNSRVQRFSGEYDMGDGAGLIRLPRRLTLVPDGDDGAPFTVQVDGYLDGATVVRKRVTTAFVPGSSRLLRVVLLRECAGELCQQDAQTTCGPGGECVPNDVDPRTLPVFTGATPIGRLDAGGTGGAGGAHDGGDPATDAPIEDAMPADDTIVACGVCTPNETAPCGRCGTKTCKADCTWGDCAGEGVCQMGEARSCGNCGTEMCNATCQWSGTCGGQGACKAGDQEPCGNCGRRTCKSDCTWDACLGDSVCAGGDTRPCGKCGTEACSGGGATCGWSGVCMNEGVCQSGQSESCGNCGTRSCNSQCGWGACQNQGSCAPGASQACGNCGTQTCSGQCAWGACQNQGSCAPNTMEACGACNTGTRTCQSTCQWGACQNVTGCTPGTMRACGTGNSGSQTCQSTCTWGTCTYPPKLVFVSSEIFAGNLGGIDGADAACQAMADRARLAGTFRAWLGEAGTALAPGVTWNRHPGPYQLVNGAKIADHWADLTDGSLRNPINVDENGNPVGASPTSRYDGAGQAQIINCGLIGDNNFVWTNVFPNGSANLGPDCGAWRQDKLGYDGLLGEWSSTGPSWTNSNNRSHACNCTARIYCFQQ